MLARNTVQLLAVYTNPESHNAQRHRQTDRQTDGRTDGRQDDANSQSYCVAIRSAKKCPQAITTQITGNVIRPSKPRSYYLKC